MYLKKIIHFLWSLVYSVNNFNSQANRQRQTECVCLYLKLNWPHVSYSETVTFKSTVQIALLLDHQRSSPGTKQKQMTFLSSWVMKESGIFWPRAGRPSDPSLRLSELQSRTRHWWSWRRDWPLPRYFTKIKGQIFLQMIRNTWISPSVNGKKGECVCMLE